MHISLFIIGFLLIRKKPSIQFVWHCREPRSTYSVFYVDVTGYINIDCQLPLLFLPSWPRLLSWKKTNSWTPHRRTKPSHKRLILVWRSHESWTLKYYMQRFLNDKTEIVISIMKVKVLRITTSVGNLHSSWLIIK